MKRILIVSCVFPPEPIVSAQISKDIAEALNKKKCKVTVLAPFPSRPAGFKFDNDSSFFDNILPGVTVVNLPSKISAESSIIGRFRESYSFGKAVSKYLSRYSANFDLVYINSWPIFSQFLIAKACKKLNLPYLVHIQDIYPESLSNKLPKTLASLVNLALLPLEKFHLKHAKKIIVISEYMRDYMIKTRDINKQNFVVVYNWQDETTFSIQKEEKNSVFTFMYLGNIGPVAGVESVIRAFGLAKLPNCDLIIAGNGANKENCRILSEDLKIKNVKFIYVPNGAVASTQNLANILLLPVIKGGANSSIPSKLPAYMFSAKPIIATLDADTATASAIINADCGWVGPPEDDLWLADQMRKVVLLSEEELEKIGRRGYVYGNENFSKEVNLNKILKQLLDVNE